MEYTRLGNTGAKVSQLCFGTWKFGYEVDGVEETTREEAHELLDAAWDLGINFIDTANHYGQWTGKSERWIGEWLAEQNREDFFVASKVYWTMEGIADTSLSRKTIRAEIEGTLERLGTDYIDLFYIHRWDDHTPIEETIRTLDALVQDGKIHYIGVSSMAAWKLMKALYTSRVHDFIQFEVAQPEFNLVNSHEMTEYIDVCTDQGLAVCPYSPLAGGFLTGKYHIDEAPPKGSRGDLEETFSDRTITGRSWEILHRLQDVAIEVDATPAQVALQWLINRSYTCVPVIGARTVAQLRENVSAVDLDLPDSAEARIVPDVHNS